MKERLLPRENHSLLPVVLTCSPIWPLLRDNYREGSFELGWHQSHHSAGLLLHWNPNGSLNSSCLGSKLWLPWRQAIRSLPDPAVKSNTLSLGYKMGMQRLTGFSLLSLCISGCWVKRGEVGSEYYLPSNLPAWPLVPHGETEHLSLWHVWSSDDLGRGIHLTHRNGTCTSGTLLWSSVHRSTCSPVSLAC